MITNLDNYIYTEKINKLNSESLAIYALILEVYKDTDNENINGLKRHIIKKIKSGENIQ